MSDTIDQELLAAEEARCRATREADAEALTRLLHEDYTHVTGGGSTINRDQYIAWVGETRRRHERGALSVKRFGDTAVIQGPLTNHLSEAGGGVRIIEAFVTQVAHRENGAWRFVAFQITPKR
jgi:hypothetical protein